MRTVRITLTAALLALLVACAESGAPTGASSSPPAPSEPTSPAATSKPEPEARTARYVAYQLRGTDGIFVYDVQADTVRLVAQTRNFAESVHFRDADTLAYMISGVLYEVDVTGGDPRLVQTLGDRALSPRWSPDGKTLAYVKLTEDGRQSQIVTLAGDKTTKVLKAIPVTELGRGFIDRDESRVTWSPDASMLLVVNTWLRDLNDEAFSVETMTLVRLDGTDVVTPRRGTFARFSPDGSTVYYRPFAAGAPMRALDVRTGSEKILPTGGNAHDPSVSPDGRYIAYHDATAAARTYVLDLQSGTVRNLGGGVMPVWVASDAVMVTLVRACVDDECGEAPRWYPTGKAQRVGLDGATAPVAAKATTEGHVSI